MTSVRQAKHQHNVQKWTQIIMEQRASGLSGLAYCRRAGINSKTFYYWQNVIQKELLASKAQYADVVETLSPSSEPLKPSKVEHETSAPKTPATSVEVAHETVEPPAESTPALPEPPESTSQEEVHFVSLEVHKAVLSTSAVTTASFGDLLWDNTYHGNRRYAAKTFATDSLYPKGRVLIMLIRELTADHIYLACGHTDMRKSIDGLAALVVSRFHLDPHQPSLFLFCGRRKDRIKGLLWDETGFLLLYKRLWQVSMAG